MAAVAGLHRSAAQILTPPSASLDVQVPVAPTPVRIGGQLHFAYELHITNFRSTDLVLTRVEVLGKRPDGAALASFQGDTLRSRLARAGARRDAPDAHVIPSGMRAVMFIWLTLDEGTPVPDVLGHRVSFEVLTAITSRSTSVSDASRSMNTCVPAASGSELVRPCDRERCWRRLAPRAACRAGPICHFHVGDTNSPLGSEGLPYVFKQFDVLGAFRSLDGFAKGDDWMPSASRRRLELPPQQAVVRF